MKKDSIIILFLSLLIICYLRKKPKEKFRKTIELIDEKTNETIRIIRFKNPKDFDSFLEDFRLMRYPGYSWRYGDKTKK